MFDNYYDACEATLTRKQVIKEVENHYLSISDFFEDCGDKEEYTGKEVLDWLGY